MARPLRITDPGTKFHVTSRAVRNLPLFQQDEDYLHYLSLIAETAIDHPFILHTYCLMTNHLHLQIETIEDPLEKIMRQINTKYARYFNKKYGHSGHLFEKRYWAELIDSPSYELDLSRYIHKNPVAAEIVTEPEDYPWSSCRTYTLGEENPLINTKQLFSFFPNPYYKNYQEFLRSPFVKNHFEELEDYLCGQK